MIAGRGGHVSGRGVYGFIQVSEEMLRVDPTVARRMVRYSMRRALERAAEGAVGPIRFRFNPFERDLNFYAPPASEGRYVVLATARSVD